MITPSGNRKRMEGQDGPQFSYGLDNIFNNIKFAQALPEEPVEEEQGLDPEIPVEVTDASEEDAEFVPTEEGAPVEGSEDDVLQFVIEKMKGFGYPPRRVKDYEEDIGLELDPDFQRGHVWSEEQQKRYVEFVLRGGRSAKEIYFNCKGWQREYEGPVVLVDGKQRLEAVRKFLRNELVIFDGKYYKDFEDRLDTIRHSFKFYINDLETRKEVLQWYIDINDGGVVHTTEEIDKVKKLLEKEK